MAETEEIKEVINPPALNLVAQVRDNVEEAYETAKEHFIATFLLLVSFLQQLSLIQVDGIEFNLWGDVFAFLKVLSLNIDLEFGEEEQDVALLTGAVASPAFLLAIFSAELETRRINKTMGTYRKPVLVTGKYIGIAVVSLLVLILGIVLYFLADSLVGTAIIVLSGYCFSYLLYITLIFLYFKTTDKEFLNFTADYPNFKTYERQLLVGVWISSIAVVGSIVFETAVLNDNDNIRVSFATLGFLALFYMILFLAFMGKVSTKELIGDKTTSFVKKLFCFSNSSFENRGGMVTSLLDENAKFVSRHKFSLYDKLIPYLKNKYWYYLFLLSIEKLILVFGQSILVTVIDPEFTALFDLIVLIIFFIFISITNPYKEKLNNIAEITSRFSNIMLLFSSFLLTIFPDDDNLEQTLNIIMISISALTAIFWMYILYKLNVITQFFRSIANNFTFIQSHYEKRALFSITNYEEFSAKIMKYKNNEIPIWLWSKLSLNEKLLTMLVFRGEPEEQVELAGDGITLNISQYLFENNEEFSEGFRKYGFSFSRNFKTISFNAVTFSERLCQFLVDSEFFAMENLTKEIFFNNSSVANMELFFEAISKNTWYEKLSFLTFRLRSSDMPVFTRYLESALHLKVISLNGNFLTDEDGVALVQSLCKHTLDEMHILNNAFSVKSYLKMGEILEEDADHLFCKKVVFNDEGVQTSITKEVVNQVQQIVQLKRRQFPELSVGVFAGTKTRMFLIVEEKVVGFNRDFWEFINRGVNGLVIPTLLLLNEEEKKACREFINFRWEDVWVHRAHGSLSKFAEETLAMKGQNAEQMKKFFLEIGLGRETVAEVVLRKGMSHVAESLQILIEFGADLSLETADGTKTIQELAEEHEDEEVQKLVA